MVSDLWGRRVTTAASPLACLLAQPGLALDGGACRRRQAARTDRLRLQLALTLRVAHLRGVALALREVIGAPGIGRTIAALVADSADTGAARRGWTRRAAIVAPGIVIGSSTACYCDDTQENKGQERSGNMRCFHASYCLQNECRVQGFSSLATTSQRRQRCPSKIRRKGPSEGILQIVLVPAACQIRLHSRFAIGALGQPFEDEAHVVPAEVHQRARAKAIVLAG